MKGRYIVESYKQFISEYTKAKSDYDKSKAETKRLWKVVQDSVVKYRKEFIKLFNSLNPDQTYHPRTDRDDDFFLDLTFNINSKDDALSTLEKLILKFEDLQSDGYDMKLSVSLWIYATEDHSESFAEMDTDNNFFYFKDSKKYKNLFVRIYLLEEELRDTALKPQSPGSVVTFLNKFEDMLEKGEDVYTRDDDEDDEDDEDE
jgi:hypothetical protein